MRPLAFHVPPILGQSLAQWWEHPKARILRERSYHYYQQIPVEHRDASYRAIGRANTYRILIQQRACTILYPFVSTRFRRAVLACILCIFLITWQVRQNHLYKIAVELANQSPIELIPYGPKNRFPLALYPNRLQVAKPRFPWENYSLLSGYFNGVKSLVPLSQWTPENAYNKSEPRKLITKQEALSLDHYPPLGPEVANPYSHFDTNDYLRDHHPPQQCFLDRAKTVSVPDVCTYPGIPQNMSAQLLGSHDLLGLDRNICYDRFGRFAAYGYGYTKEDGGLGPGIDSEQTGADQIYSHVGYRNYSQVDWEEVQNRCHEKNKARFEDHVTKRKVSRHAFLLRIWDGFHFGDHHHYTMRAMINELALKSGGEYDIIFLLHVKNGSLPWTTNSTMREVIANRTLPREFRKMAVFWSEEQMMTYYKDVRNTSFANPAMADRPAKAGIHGVLRSAHFPVQWFAQQRPDYDYYWNWEMDVRMTGHYYDFFSKAGDWAKKQPRKGLWERNARFYIEKVHGPWPDFVAQVEKETLESGRPPIWGPVNTFPNSGMIPSPNETTPPHPYYDDDFTWGVGEDADFLAFDPIFEPNTTNWQFQGDVTGYDLHLPIPPRRCSIVAISRMSKRLVNLMHRETQDMQHTMFLEMWAPSIALHHGLKAVYVPHPVFYDRDWDLGRIDQALNRPATPESSPFGWGEHNMFGSSYYFDSRFAEALWKRWLGIRVCGRGGKMWEERGTGRMCLQTMLLHPIKDEGGRTD